MAELQAALLTCLTALVAVVGKYVVSTVKTYLGQKGILKELETKKVYIRVVVDAMQQIFTEADGEEKFATAKKQAVKYLNDNGISFTDDELEMLIEAAVKGVKDGLKDEPVKE